jgi:hypothetical protein
VADWALWAEAVDGDEHEPVRDAEPAEVDDSLEARRLSRWLRAMFGGPKDQRDDSES